LKRKSAPGYYVDPFGCVKNQVDAENMMARLDCDGWISSRDAEDADLIIVNSCGFIESAKQESINAVLEWRKSYPDKKILLAGCLAQRYKTELAESLPEADGFFGTDDISKITDAVNAFNLREDNSDETGEPHTCITPTGARPLLSLPGSAYVKISEGCNHTCSFCAIPLIRGSMRCRTAEDILDECRRLLARGIRELCIVGQDICSYRCGGFGLVELLYAIGEIPGDFWVRLLYLYPDNFPMRILDLMENDRRFLPYFDIPLQHGSAGVLSAMNRYGTSESYLAMIGTIRSRLPAAVIRTTFLVGFPGETEDDFAALVDFQKKLRPDWLGCFAYSREEGTASYGMKGRVSKKTAGERKREIEQRQVAITERNMERFVGQTLDVLLEEKLPGEDGRDDFWLGRLYCHAPEVDGAAVVVGETGAEAKAGAVLQCRVVARRGFDLEVGVGSFMQI